MGPNAAMMTPVCATCVRAVSPSRRRPPFGNAYCSDKCGERYWSRRQAAQHKAAHRQHLLTIASICPGCGSSFTPERVGQIRCRKGCGRDKRLASVRQCRTCGKKFRLHNERSAFCSKKCSAIETGQKLSRPTSCDGCGASLPRFDGKPVKRCEPCAKEKLRELKAKRETDKAVRADERARSLQRTCLWCQSAFTARAASERLRCCSNVCRTRLQATIRKQRLKGLAPTVISVVLLYHRDKGRCGLCHKRVPLTKKYPHPLAATVDHIVPITKGGTHAFENVQLAHARCNRLKGNRAGGQLRLFG